MEGTVHILLKYYSFVYANSFSLATVRAKFAFSISSHLDKYTLTEQHINNGYEILYQKQLSQQHWYSPYLESSALR